MRELRVLFRCSEVRTTLLVWVLAIVFAVPAHSAQAEVRQWRPFDLEFESEKPHSPPVRVQLTGIFISPDGARFEQPGFWDGGNVWKIRFAPTIAGTWSFVTVCSDLEDRGLHGRRGSFEALGAAGDNPLWKHGGFLRVSDNGRYLTYSDGKPFFWLGDTWWFCPSKLCPIGRAGDPPDAFMFQRWVDMRQKQGFTVVQMAFMGPHETKTPHLAPDQWDESNVEFWRAAEGYVAYANQAGIIPIIGVGFGRDVDESSLESLELLWRYLVGRIGAYAVTWLIVGEYNLDNVPARVAKVLAVGKFIKQIDPYKRAMTVHPWYYKGDNRQAWTESWYDFIMLQCGHGGAPTELYLGAYDWAGRKPVLEAECNYEGVLGHNADSVRAAAYRAIQSGSFGYTYGAHGMWYPIHSLDDRTVAQWGVPILWSDAILKPGAEQMHYLRTAYEAVDWWQLEPRPDSIITSISLPEHQKILVKGAGDKTFVVYFPGRPDSRDQAKLAGLAPASRYSSTWINPRDGARFDATEIDSVGTTVDLPPPPDNYDWLLLLQKVS